jgi:hypothetical protein
MFVSDYLQIHPADSSHLSGLHWSPAHAYVEYGDGKPFAHVVEAFMFLEGFGSQRPLMHFGHVLHFLYMLRHGRGPTPWQDFSVLAEAWRAAGRPARTAGALCALLCQDVPAVSDSPRPEDLPVWLSVCSRTTADVNQVTRTPEATPLYHEVFEATLAAALEGYSKEDLEHWFRHGQGPVRRQGEELAKSLLADKPPNLEAVLAEISRHDRLSGAVPFVAQLVGALTLPPRKLIDRDLPLGGYADVTTRGQPDQILASQFALDELEFLRRYAENELLLYRREEPATQTREELVVLLDQGVRTWGRPRLALAAAVFALGQLARRRRLPLLLAATSNQGTLVDPLTAPASALADMLAASDLSANPGLALEQVLSDPEANLRDVVLLTHPRNLAELDVMAAARTARGHTRLFAVAVDGHGECRFDELRHGAPVAIGRFRIDLTTPAPPPPQRREPVDGRVGAAWKGDVEPIGFPFRFGLAGNVKPLRFAFDYAGEWLLAAGQAGMLCACRTDGGRHEILPRPFVSGAVLTAVDRVLGVSGGFVVGGTMKGMPIAAHYNFTDRIVKCYEFAPSNDLNAREIEWRYARSLHLLILRIGQHFRCVPLTTRRGEVPVPEHLLWGPLYSSDIRTPTMVVLPSRETGERGGRGDGWSHPWLSLRPTSGKLEPTLLSGGWKSFTPIADGRPALAGSILQRAEQQGDVLAVLTIVDEEFKKNLWLFRGPGGETITQYSLACDRDEFALSVDGRLLALQLTPGQVQVRGTRSGDIDIHCSTPIGRFHNNLTVELGDRWLSITIGGIIHLAHWERGELVLLRHAEGSRRLREDVLQASGLTFMGTPARPGRIALFEYDANRFRMYAWRHDLIAVVDAFGEVFLFERHTRDLVCAFFVFRQQIAVWMPDGTSLGSEALLGRPATPDAAHRIGGALLRAWRQGESS